MTNVLRPSRATIVIELVVGLMLLTLAVLDATRFQDQTELHDDLLLTVLMAAVGGIAVGLGIAHLVVRAAATRTTAQGAPADA